MSELENAKRYIKERIAFLKATRATATHTLSCNPGRIAELEVVERILLGVRISVKNKKDAKRK